MAMYTSEGEGSGGYGPPFDDPVGLQGLPPRTRVFARIGAALVAFVLLFVLLSIGRSIFTDWLWFSHLGLQSVYTTILVARVSLFAAGFIVMAVFIALSYRAAYRVAWGPSVLALAPGTLSWLRRALVLGAVGIGLIVALSFASVLSGRWELFLKFMNSTPWGMQDPQFGNDVSFYVFTMPVLHTVQGWLMGAAIVTIITTAVMYYVIYSIRGISLEMSPGLRTHIAVVGAGLMFTFAAAHFLDTYETLFSTSGAVVGATYADVTARVPALRLIASVAVIAGLLMLFTIRLPNLTQAMRLIMAAVGLWIAAALLAGVVWPSLVQRFVVAPAELERERPYIGRNIEWTRLGFDLDRVTEQAYEVNDDTLAVDLAANPETVQNIRLWDPRPLLDVYNQIQHLRLYYGYLDVDVDRYLIDGEYRQVLLGTRELIPEGLDPSAQNWVNRTLVYTHGYGIVMSPATDFTPGGQPEFFIKDVPPSGDIPVLEPRVYYGENTNDFVIVNSEEAQFDRPADVQGALPVYIERYEGSGGVRLSSFTRRLAYSWELGDVNVFISGQVTNESTVLYRRNIRDRVAAITPFLRLDRDPYMVVHEGGLFWIQDAYTVTDRLPYSKRLDNRDFNYIRNSVKVVIDAFNGSVTFYTIEPRRPDPLLTVYRNIFPALFKPIEEMPQGMREHIRYPEVLLRAQAITFLQYHMTDPKEFFLKEDQWAIPNEVVMESQSQPVDPYYVIMKLPGQDGAEFVMILPFTPQDKPNLVAWIAARSDGEHYGDILLYTFPKDRLFNGPSQIEARIDNDPKISEQFTLWGQSGSIVIRGNLLVIPIGESLLYAEPIYLQAEALEFPELKRVILATADDVVMEPTLREAVATLVGGARVVRRPDDGEPVPGGIAPEDLQRIFDAFQEGLGTLREGVDQLDESLETLDQLAGGQSP